MIKRVFIKIFFTIFTVANKFLKLFKIYNLFQGINDFIQENAYVNLNLNNKKVKFFVPSKLSLYRVSTILEKEPETIDWIKKFEKNSDNEIIFWDIGANVGIYSIFAACYHDKIKIISFEASTSNLRCLSRNISINDYNKKVSICQIPLTNKENIFFEMKEKNFIEGGAISTFGEDYDYTGKKIVEFNNKYKIFGTSINYLLENKILKVPNYIKLDVDGIEHLILEGANKFLSHKDLKGISVELNEEFSSQYQESTNLLKNCGFSLISHDEISDKKSEKKIITRNYHFKKI